MTTLVETTAPGTLPQRAARFFPGRFLLVATTIAGLLSGLRIYVTYNLLGVQISLFDGLGSGVMDWLLWIPLAPLAFWLAERFDAERGFSARNLGLHVAAGVGVSFAQLALFALLSGVVRTLRFGDALRLDLSSPLLMKLVPGIGVYWILVLGWWWRRSRARGMEPSSVFRPEVDPVLEFQAGRGRLRLRAREIDWVDAAGNYVELHAGAATHLVRETLKEAHQKLGAEDFLRIHRSTLVRRDAIVTLLSRGPRPGVVLRDGTRLDVGRKYRPELDGLEV